MPNNNDDTHNCIKCGKPCDCIYDEENCEKCDLCYDEEDNDDDLDEDPSDGD